MKTIPKATSIELTQDDRTVLEGFVRSTKTEYRLLQRARIVLLAAGGMATRAIGREVGCTTGTASKWRVRFAKHRLEGLSETGNRGAAPKYTAQTDKRILAQLDTSPPDGYGRWSGPLHWVMLMCNMSGVFCGRKRSTLPDASPGVRAMTPILPPRRPRLSVFISPRRRMRWCWRSMRSLQYRRWNGFKGT